MPIQEMIEIRKSGNKQTKLALLLATHCAPLIRNLAIANVLSVSVYDVNIISLLLRGTNIKCVILAVRGKQAVLYLYREDELKAYLKKDEVLCFLEKYGYSRENYKGLLGKLSKRIRLHSDGKASYPHEIGLFLGYPIEDVAGFVENEGQNYLHMGYWKVYYNVNESMKLFEKYDEAREWAVLKVVKGESLLDIAG